MTIESDFENLVGELVVTKNADGHIVAVTIQNEDSKILKVLAQSAPARANNTEWNNCFLELLEDYVKSRIESALLDTTRVSSGIIHFPKPRLNALLIHIGINDGKARQSGLNTTDSQTSISKAYESALA